MSFQDLNIEPWLKRAVQAMGFTNMTPVQENSIPLFLKNKDLVVEAVTGSGKTLAYLLPAIQKVLRRDADEIGIGALVIAPTRELATQIFNVTQELLVYQDEDEDKDGDSNSQKTKTTQKRKLTAVNYIGGKDSVAQDIRLYKKTLPEIVIGTPGRINELLDNISTKGLEILILDEADTLIDMGFQKTLQSIISRLPKQRRTGLFSATMNDTISSFLRVAGLRNSVRITVNVAMKQQDARTPLSLSIQSMVVPVKFKLQCLLKLLSTTSFEKAIVFFLSCATVDYFTTLLAGMKLPYDIVPLHGKQAPSNRTRHFEQFVSASKKTVLFTTDVAARGLDIPNVDIVLQMDPPLDPKSFSHRAGRAGRAGKRGLSIVMLHEGREEEYEDLLRVRKVPIQRAEIPEGVCDETALKELVSTLRKACKKDRDIYEKGLRAFVSHVKAYSKHQASFIFRVKELDLPQMATAYALLHLPKMPELRDVEYTDEDFTAEKVDTASIAFRDTNREKARQAALEKQALSPESHQPSKKRKKQTEAWSKQKERKEKRVERREKRRNRREKIREARELGTADSVGKAKEAITSTNDSASEATTKPAEEETVPSDSGEDLSELDDDYRALKKEKKAKRVDRATKGKKVDILSGF
ncbi:ATP-dependent RNA helicase Spb4 [Schizosaccharomyces japonicus yFS275]|uniref:RNA helicase n=1 Tax=Schizosaccharomyces japonicus (strain yFS275 / FY16936) TaxID=402676 RepID=B6JW47_SCHJY|nr:ATP-dependent RNA helicase Spb4 [Schizosaccharomyces japonicus yFS275]EEB05598.2 ATP-dependent RNA helicase Spb4 [Schizosaccharomyces japonicus yFS275]